MRLAHQSSPPGFTTTTKPRKLSRSFRSPSRPHLIRGSRSQQSNSHALHQSPSPGPHPSNGPTPSPTSPPLSTRRSIHPSQHTTTRPTLVSAPFPFSPISTSILPSKAPTADSLLSLPQQPPFLLLRLNLRTQTRKFKPNSRKSKSKTPPSPPQLPTDPPQTTTPPPNASPSSTGAPNPPRKPHHSSPAPPLAQQPARTSRAMSFFIVIRTLSSFLWRRRRLCRSAHRASAAKSRR